MAETPKPGVVSSELARTLQQLLAPSRSGVIPEPSAPAAPSVGEPEVNVLADEALAEYDRGETRPVPEPTCAQCGGPVRRFDFIGRPDVYECERCKLPGMIPPSPAMLDDLVRVLALGATAKGTYLTPEQSAALRSSLEEARKDTRRLEWLMMEDRRPWTRDEIDANLEDRA